MNVQGFDAARAARRVCGALGVDIALTDADLRDSERPDELRRILYRTGLLPRTVTLGPGDLETLQLPALLRASDGSWLLALRRKVGTLVVEGATGAHRRRYADLTRELSDTAIEITVSPRGDSVWQALAGAVVTRRRSLLLAIAAPFCIQTLNLLIPQLTRIVVDESPLAGTASAGAAVAAAILGVAVFRSLGAWIRDRCIVHLRVALQVVAERGFVDHILRVPFGTLQRYRTGDFMQALAGLGEARAVLTERIAVVILDGTMAVLYLLVMAATLPWLTVMVAGTGLSIALCSAWFAPRHVACQQAIVEAQAKQRSFLFEVLNGIATVKGNGAERHALRRWLDLLEEQLHCVWNQQRARTSADITVDSTRTAGAVAVLVLGAAAAIEGGVTLGTFVAFVQMGDAFLAAVLALSQSVIAMLALRPQLEKTNALWRTRPLPNERQTRPVFGRGIELKDVWFRYEPDAPWVLSEYRLQIEEGGKHRICGPSGSGKSTVLRILSGLSTPERGDVSVAGCAPATVRAALLYIPQNLRLFTGSIYENLEWLSAHASRQRILAACEASGFHEHVRQLPMGYDTFLTAGAMTLSGGQRQLLAISAAMASDRRVLLLDETFANLDWSSRQVLIGTPWFADKTIVYASHDSTLT